MRLFGQDRTVRAFEELVAEAERADIDGWGFDWLDGRATEQRPPWGYARLLADRLARACVAVDLDTGGGEVVDEAPVLPRRMVVTEGWPANATRARRRLGPRGVDVVATVPGERLPLPDNTFDLVTSRHPVAPDWTGIHRILQPGGEYLAQHVGTRSVRTLSEYFLGPLGDLRDGRDPRLEAAAAERAGLQVTDLLIATCRIEIFDVGAMIYLLRKCIWWVPDFSVDRYRDRLAELDHQLRTAGPFITASTRHLIRARKPS